MWLHQRRHMYCSSAFFFSFFFPPLLSQLAASQQSRDWAQLARHVTTISGSKPSVKLRHSLRCTHTLAWQLKGPKCWLKWAPFFSLNSLDYVPPSVSAFLVASVIEIILFNNKTDGHIPPDSCISALINITGTHMHIIQRLTICATALRWTLAGSLILRDQTQ